MPGIRAEGPVEAHRDEPDDAHQERRNLAQGDFFLPRALLDRVRHAKMPQDGSRRPEGDDLDEEGPRLPPRFARDQRRYAVDEFRLDFAALFPCRTESGRGDERRRRDEPIGSSERLAARECPLRALLLARIGIADRPSLRASHCRSPQHIPARRVPPDPSSTAAATGI